MNTSHLQNIPIENIHPDPHQPRNLFPTLDELIEKEKSGDRRAQEIWARLLELSTSILEVGLQQPISVYQAGEEGQYIILDGHRRWLAVALLYRQGAGDGTIECYIYPRPQANDILLGQLNVNIQREDLNVFELARSLQRIYDDLQVNGGTVRLATASDNGHVTTLELPPNAPSQDIWDVIEKKVGISRSRRYQIQAVLKLPPQIQQIAEESALPESRLRYLVPVKDEQILETIIWEIVEQDLSNAEIKKRIKELQEELVTPPAPTMPKPMRIKSAIKPIRQLATELDGVHNAPAAISTKDPRTVRSYKGLIPELREALGDLEKVLKTLEFLEEG